MRELGKNSSEKQGRLIAIVIAGSVLFWSILQGAAPTLQISPRYMFLIDFFTLAALTWSLILLIKIIIKLQRIKLKKKYPSTLIIEIYEKKN